MSVVGALRMITGLATKFSNDIFPELMDGTEMVDEFVLPGETFVIVAVFAVVLRSGLGCDVAIQCR